VDLTPKNGTFDPVGGYTGYVPGWTARGHAGYWGYAWYRIRVVLSSTTEIWWAASEISPAASL
jgi:hypothetical protein